MVNGEWSIVNAGGDEGLGESWRGMRFLER